MPCRAKPQTLETKDNSRNIAIWEQSKTSSIWPKTLNRVRRTGTTWTSFIKSNPSHFHFSPNTLIQWSAMFDSWRRTQSLSDDLGINRERKFVSTAHWSFVAASGQVISGCRSAPNATHLLYTMVKEIIMWFAQAAGGIRLSRSN